MRLRIPGRGAVEVCLSVLLVAAGTQTSRAATISVGSGGDLQAAINAAQPGDVIALAPGATYVGNFTLPNKGSSTLPITIRSAAADSQLPPAGVRMTPAYAPFLPKLKSPNSVAVLRTASAAHHWTLMFLEFQGTYRGYNRIIELGAGDSTQTLLTQVPHHLVLDRLYVHGDPVFGQKGGVSLNSSDTVVINSHISDIKGIGQDAIALGGWNGPGNYLIENNYIEASTENVLFGGADPPIPNLVTTNIVFRGNYLSKPLAWRYPIVSTPQSVGAIAAPGGGSLPEGTYYYKVVARMMSYTGIMASSAGSAEVSAAIAPGTTGGVQISWTPVAGAADYRVYGRKAGAEDVYWTTTNPFFTDTGAAGTTGTPGSGTKWLVKNSFELKNAQDVLVEGNVFENVWIHGQSGYAITLTPRNQSGGAPWAVVQRVTFRGNVIRHAAGAVNILGTDNIYPSQLSNHLAFTDNVMDDISTTWGAGSRPFQIGDGADSVSIDHNTIMTNQSAIVGLYGGTASSPTPLPHLVYTNNMSPHNSYGIIGASYSAGLPSIQAYAPDGIVTANVLAGGTAKYPPGNYFPTVLAWQAGFVNYSGGDYHLLASSPYNNVGTDGKDLGADIDLVNAGTSIALKGDNRASGGTTSVTTFQSLTSSSAYPLLTDTPATWTALATNGSGAVEYQFWFFKKTGWVLGQAYSTSNTYTWTPRASDVGTPYYVQVWARRVGSTASYEAFRGTTAFDVAPAPLTLTADVLFPTPPGNQVTWTATLATPPTVAVEYKFQVVDLSTNTTTVLRTYSSSNQAQWVPPAAGRFVVQALERKVGSTAAYDLMASSPTLDVAATPLTITSLSTTTTFPAPTGAPITWTVQVQGGMVGPIEYEFWLYSPVTGWRNAQPYGPNATFTWTPTWTDEGDYALQVWVRNNGSTAWYDAYTGTSLFHIQRASLQLTTPTLFPVAINTPITWTADVPDPSVSMEYEFWLYSTATSKWTLGRGYGTGKTFTWTPSATGTFGLQVWAREIGSTASYDQYRSTGLFDVVSQPAQMVSLNSDVTLPAAAGTKITWKAGATGGTAPVEYQFWRLDGPNWIMVQGYSSLNTYNWTPMAADVGQHAIQARVRSTGSSAAYESQMTTAVFEIK